MKYVLLRYIFFHGTHFVVISYHGGNCFVAVVFCHGRNIVAAGYGHNIIFFAIDYFNAQDFVEPNSGIKCVLPREKNVATCRILLQ
jgi:hypothetical protein